jgi:formylglycine-generating enzyme required for sulfatase activity
MHGNVSEWCWDWLGNAYETEAMIALMGVYVYPKSNRVCRGGSWDSNDRYLRSAFRDGNSPSYRLNRIGFRLLRSSL